VPVQRRPSPPQPLPLHHRDPREASMTRASASWSSAHSRPRPRHSHRHRRPHRQAAPVPNAGAREAAPPPLTCPGRRRHCRYSFAACAPLPSRAGRQLWPRQEQPVERGRHSSRTGQTCWRRGGAGSRKGLPEDRQARYEHVASRLQSDLCGFSYPLPWGGFARWLNGLTKSLENIRHLKHHDAPRLRPSATHTCHRAAEKREGKKHIETCAATHTSACADTLKNTALPTVKNCYELVDTTRINKKKTLRHDALWQA